MVVHGKDLRGSAVATRKQFVLAPYVDSFKIAFATLQLKREEKGILWSRTDIFNSSIV